MNEWYILKSQKLKEGKLNRDAGIAQREKKNVQERGNTTKPCSAFRILTTVLVED